jgi:hypothetical protein
MMGFYSYFSRYCILGETIDRKFRWGGGVQEPLVLGHENQRFLIFSLEKNSPDSLNHKKQPLSSMPMTSKYRMHDIL